MAEQYGAAIAHRPQSGHAVTRTEDGARTSVGGVALWVVIRGVRAVS